MQSFLIDMGVQLLSHSWQLFALVAGGLMIGGMCLGMAKRTFVKLVDGGDFLAARFMEKPRAIAVVGVIAALVIPSFVIGWGMSPTKIVKEEVQVPVADSVIVDKLQGELSAAQMLVGVAKAKAERLEEEKGVAEVQKAAADVAVQKISKELKHFKPEGEDAERRKIEELQAEMDAAHANEAWATYRYGDSRRLRVVSHLADRKKPDAFRDSAYHRGCKICDENLRIKKEIDAIHFRNPEWAKR